MKSKHFPWVSLLVVLGCSAAEEETPEHLTWGTESYRRDPALDVQMTSTAAYARAGERRRLRAGWERRTLTGVQDR